MDDMARIWPIIYFGKIQSVPEYFERRFSTGARHAATALILLYLIGYVGINLYTLVQSLTGLPIMAGAIGTAFIVMLYMFAVGIYHFGDFWALLPRGHKFVYSEFNSPDSFSFFGMGEASYKFTRSFFGLAVCGGIGIIVSLVTTPRSEEQLVGLVNGTQLQAMHAFKGSTPNRTPGDWATLAVSVAPTLTGMENVHVPQAALETLSADIDDLIYITDPRWWFGGLRSFHAKVTATTDSDTLLISQEAFDYAHFKQDQQVSVEKIM